MSFSYCAFSFGSSIAPGSTPDGSPDSGGGAVEAIDLYLAEGRDLTKAIKTRYAD